MSPAAIPAYRVDDSRLPLLSITPTAAVKDEAALDATYAALDRFAARNEPFALVIDVRGAASDPKRRKRMQRWLKAHEAWTDRCLVATAVIVSSSIERGFVTAAMWLVSPRTETRVFTERSAAEVWAHSTYKTWAASHQGGTP